MDKEWKALVETGHQGPLPIRSISEYQSAGEGTSLFIPAAQETCFVTCFP